MGVCSFQDTFPPDGPGYNVNEMNRNEPRGMAPHNHETELMVELILPSTLKFLVGQITVIWIGAAYSGKLKQTNRRPEAVQFLIIQFSETGVNRALRLLVEEIN
jgi:hypothetical protein